jgi:hypothetical protein
VLVNNAMLTNSGWFMNFATVSTGGSAQTAYATVTGTGAALYNNGSLVLGAHTDNTATAAAVVTVDGVLTNAAGGSIRVMPDSTGGGGASTTILQVRQLFLDNGSTFTAGAGSTILITGLTAAGVAPSSPFLVFGNRNTVTSGGGNVGSVDFGQSTVQLGLTGTQYNGQLQVNAALLWEVNSAGTSSGANSATTAFEIRSFLLRGSNTYAMLVPGSISGGMNPQFNLVSGEIGGFNGSNITDYGTLDLNGVAMQVRGGSFTIWTNSGLMDNSGDPKNILVEGGMLNVYGYLGGGAGAEAGTINNFAISPANVNAIGTLAIINDGTYQPLTNGSVTLVFGGIFINDSAAHVRSVDATSLTVDFNPLGAPGVQGVFTNRGRIAADGSGVVQITTKEFTNEGSVTVSNGGSVTITQTISSVMNMLSGGLVAVTGSNSVIYLRPDFDSGNGTFALASGNVIIGSSTGTNTIVLRGNLSNAGGNIILRPGGTLSVSGLIVNSGSITADTAGAAGTVNGVVLNTSGGDIVIGAANSALTFANVVTNAAGGLVNFAATGQLNFNNGLWISSGGSMQVASGAIATATGALTNAGLISNAGTILQGSTGALNIYLASSGTVSNAGTLMATSAGAKIQMTSGSGTITNTGNIVASNAGFVNLSLASLDNSGSLLALQASSISVTMANGSPVSSAGGIVASGGTILLDVGASGTMSLTGGNLIASNGGLARILREKKWRNAWKSL